MPILAWLETDIVMISPTHWNVTLMVGIAVESMLTHNIVLNVNVNKEISLQCHLQQREVKILRYTKTNEALSV